MAKMDKQTQKALKEAYKQIKTYMGVIQIKNKINGKIFIAGFPNLKNKWLTIQSQLAMGMHVNSRLQQDWNELGPKAFSYEVLEQKATDEVNDVRWEMKQMEKQWCEKLQPYEDQGYNKPPQ